MTILEPESACELGLGPSEKLESKGVLEPETVSVMDPVVVLAPKTMSGLEPVLGMTLESMTMSALKKAPEGSPFPKRGFEMETSHQEWMVKLGLRPVSV